MPPVCHRIRNTRFLFHQQRAAAPPPVLFLLWITQQYFCAWSFLLYAFLRAVIRLYVLCTHSCWCEVQVELSLLRPRGCLSLARHRLDKGESLQSGALHTLLHNSAGCAQTGFGSHHCTPAAAQSDVVFTGSGPDVQLIQPRSPRKSE